MDKLYVPVLILLTSLIGYLGARRVWRTQREQVTQAIQRSLEFIGCWMLVYGANLLLGAVLILLIRRLTGFFISVYVLNSVMLVLFSLLQALVVYHLWLLHHKGQ
ncbi:MAG: hypothetical protein RMM08_13705 [Armatimonadota bacterium]|nr:hypothetical protein [bacterium]MDW8322409.1 hypothetical protein [Armatimonadota bacterium]